MPPLRNNLNLYDDMADHWWDHTRRFARLLHKLVPARMAHFDKVAPQWAGLDVLDLGCGGGIMSEALARRGARVVGVDPALRALEAARSHASQGGLSIIYREGRGDQIPLEDQSVDRVVCVDVLEHIPDLAPVFAEVRRVLRPGGIFLFDTINAGPLASLVVVHVAESLLGVIPKGTHDPALFVSPDRLSQLMRASGLKLQSLAGMGPVGLDRRLDFNFGLIPTTAIMYVGHATRD